MGGTGVIDRFLAVFTQYIDSGFGLLQPEVAFVAKRCSGRGAAMTTSSRDW
jgi:type IV secretory pathway TrbL component